MGPDHSFSGATGVYIDIHVAAINIGKNNWVNGYAELKKTVRKTRVENDIF